MSRRPADFGSVPLPPVPVPPVRLWRRGIVSVQRAAAFLDVRRSTVYRLMKGGELPYTRIGGVRRISRAALEELAERKRVKVQ